MKMKPDMLIESTDERVIVDTKWKRMDGGKVSRGDLYQLYAYAKRYDASRCVLLFPEVAGAVPAEYTLEGDGGRESELQTRTIPLGLELPRERAVLVEALRERLGKYAAKGS
jgi:5-methylcytosine-specific restriction enzyme subunit McrC